MVEGDQPFGPLPPRYVIPKVNSPTFYHLLANLLLQYLV